MKKRFMAALLCLCLLTGGAVAAATTANENETQTGNAAVSGGATGGGTDTDGADAAATQTGGWVIADNLGSTADEEYVLFDTTAAEAAYSTSVDIYAQAIDTAYTNADRAYKVELVWGDMAFAWGATDAITKTWTPSDHSYDDNKDSRKEEWYLISDAALTRLEYNDEAGTYDSILTGTQQNYVLMFNHSNAAVNANVKITEIYQGAEDEDTAATDSDNITATIAPVESFGVAGTENETEGGYDFALDFDDETEVIYSGTNGTAGAACVTLANEPAENVLNETTSTTVARITVKITIPAADGTEETETTQQS